MKLYLIENNNFEGQKMKRISLIFITILNAVIFANDAPIVLVGANASPILSQDIVMESEKIEIELSNFEAKVNCSFKFKNLGEKQTVTMGFPEVSGYLELSAIHNFITIIDGKNIDIIKVPGDSVWDNWFTWQVEFEKNEEIVVNNSYMTGRDAGAYRGIFKYILETGSGWKDFIKHSEIIIRLSNIDFSDLANISPKNYSITENTLTWDFYDFEPTYINNIEIKYHIDLSPNYWLQNYFWDGSKAESSEDVKQEKLIENAFTLYEQMQYHHFINKINEFFQTYELKHNTELYSVINLMLCHAYKFTGDYVSAIEIIQNNNDSLSLYSKYFELAKLYEQFQEYKKSIEHYKKSKFVFNREEFKDVLEFESMFYDMETIESYVIPFLHKDGMNAYCDYKIKILEELINK
jgi:tetratricopeptide (TPR) repeat protein